MGHEEARGYATAHVRVRQARGPAREHTCPCGAQAAQWAYDHNDPDPRTATVSSPPRRTTVVTWSDDPAHYIAMCESCHASFDLEHGNRARIAAGCRELNEARRARQAALAPGLAAPQALAVRCCDRWCGWHSTRLWPGVEAPCHRCGNRIEVGRPATAVEKPSKRRRSVWSDWQAGQLAAHPA